MKRIKSRNWIFGRSVGLAKYVLQAVPAHYYRGMQSRNKCVHVIVREHKDVRHTDQTRGLRVQ